MRNTSKESKALEDLKAAIWRMPFVDRACLLSLSIVEHNRNDLITACLGLVECASRMAPHLPVEQRYRLAERMRSAADHLEIAPVDADEGATP